MVSEPIYRVRALIPVADGELVPLPSLFLHPSRLHGQAHVARVLVHAFRLIAATGRPGLAPALWASVYLHDIARRHDGRCLTHGADAWVRLARLPDVQAVFARGGVRPENHPAIQLAVSLHCKGEAEPRDPYAPLVNLLKDADGLDRVRLHDLNPRFLRHDEARAMVPFAERLFHDTNAALTPGPEYFSQLWPEALRIAAAEPRPREDVNER